MRWLHLSDFHTGKDNYGQRRLYSELINHIRSRCDQGDAPDFVFITGDLANKGIASEYELFYEGFLSPLAGLVESTNVPQILVVPGNHDVDRTAAEFVEAHTLLRRAPRLFDPNEGGLSQRRNLLPRFENFRDGDTSWSGDHWLESERGAFTVSVELRGTKVGIVGLNTAWLSENDQDRHRLTPGIPLLETALDAVGKCDVKIVLGHHPIDWFADEEVRPIQTLLAHASAFYLHGHRHRSRADHYASGGAGFLSLQSGAAFQARESEQWVNGFMWVDFDPRTRAVAIEPLIWSRDHREWTIDGSALPNGWMTDRAGFWQVPFPSIDQIVKPAIGSGDEPISGIGAALFVGEGWQVMDQATLDSRKQPVEVDELVRYFDGRVPRWAIALSPSVPRREIVGDLTESIQEQHGSGQIGVTLLLAAGGEGKSTAVLQAAALALEGGLVQSVLWHYDPETRLRPDDLLRLPRSDKPWLVLSDDADLIALDVLRAVEALFAAGRRDIQFLLCTRDTDWHAARGAQLPFEGIAQLKIKRLRGLSNADAEAVIQAWTQVGQRGLGRLATVSYPDAVRRLVEAASQTDESEGAFLGAMLRVRIGPEMREHVRALLKRLESRRAPGGTLLDGFGLIALAHAEGLSLLSAPVLARALGCNTSEVRRKIMTPLGEEAAAVSAGQVLLTRHIAIAETAVALLEEMFEFDREDNLVELVAAAHRAGRDGEFVYERGAWEYLGKRYFEKGEQALGFRMARTVMELNPHNAMFRAHYAHLYRLANQPGEAIKVFADGGILPKRHRGYFAEWGTAEHQAGNNSSSAWLLALSLSDATEQRPIDIGQAAISLPQMEICFRALAKAYRDDTFSSAAKAAYEAVHDFLERKSSSASAEGAEIVSTMIARGAVHAWEQKERALPEWVTGPEKLSLEGLVRLLRNSAR